MRARATSGALALAALAAFPSAASSEAASLQVVPTPTGKIVYELSYTGERKGGWLEVSNLDGSERRVLTTPPKAGQRRWDVRPSWSPEGGSIAFVRSVGGSSSYSGRKQLRVIGADGGGERRVAVGTGRNALGPAVWSRDGARLLFVRQERDSCSGFDALYTVVADGANLSRLLRPVINRTLAALDWSPDSSAALFETASWDIDCRDSDYRGGTFSTLSLAGGNPKVVVGWGEYDLLDPGQAAWSTDGRSLAFTGKCSSVCTIFRVPSMGGRPRPLTGFRSPTDPFYEASERDDLSFAWSRAGNQILYGRQRGLFSVEASTGVTRRLATTSCPAQRTCRRSQTFVEAQSLQGDLVAFSTKAWTRDLDVESEQLDVTTSDGAGRWSVPYPRAARRGAELSGFSVFLD
jgi:Tol biopolymer transport system component